MTNFWKSKELNTFLGTHWTDKETVGGFISHTKLMAEGRIIKELRQEKMRIEGAESLEDKFKNK